MSKNVQTCRDPIKLSEAGRLLGKSTRTLRRWAAMSPPRLVIYRDRFTTTRFVSRAAVVALLPVAEAPE